MPKREENRSVRFSSLLGTSHLSTDRGSPPSLKRRGLTESITQRGSRAVGIFKLKRQRRGDYLTPSKT